MVKFIRAEGINFHLLFYNIDGKIYLGGGINFHLLFYNIDGKFYLGEVASRPPLLIEGRHYAWAASTASCRVLYVCVRRGEV